MFWFLDLGREVFDDGGLLGCVVVNYVGVFRYYVRNLEKDIGL